MMEYYIYAYLRLDVTPYYIGKGKGSRAWNTKHICKIPKDPSVSAGHRPHHKGYKVYKKEA